MFIIKSPFFCPQVRDKRSVGSAQCEPGQSSCCLSSLSVNLTQLGWTFVIYPQIIEFTYCGGHCDPFRLPPSMFVPGMAQLRWVSYCNTPEVHCKENPIYVFLYWELRGLSPKLYIHVSASDL